MPLFFKAFALVFALLFAWAAYLQNNDPDALLWYIIYGGAALACIVFTTGKLNFLAAIFMAVAFLIGAFFSWPDRFQGVEIGGGDIENIERAREALGLLINAAVFIIIALRIQWKRKHTS